MTSHINERQARREMADVCTRMYDRGYIVSADGNVSVRLGPGRILMTPSGLTKGSLTPDDMIVVDGAGKKVSGKHNPTSEVAVHLLCYEERPDVHAVVHGHPPLTTAFSVAGVSLAQCVLPEVILSLGTIPTAPYATPTTQAAAESIRATVRDYDAVILDRHGTVCIAATLTRAFNLLEQLEHTARITLAARQLGGIQTLPKDEVVRLQDMARRFGTPIPALQNATAPVCDVNGACDTSAPLMPAAPDPANPCGSCNTCGNPRPLGDAGHTAAVQSSTITPDDRLTQIITEEVARVLAQRAA